MSDEIDYETLYKRMVLENEALRLGMLKARLQRDVSFPQRLAHLRDFVESNYLVLVFSLILLSTLCSGVYVLWRDRSE